MNLTIKPLTEATAADFFDFFDNRAFSDGSPYAPCYCNCFQLTPDHVRMHIGERASALGGGFEGLRLSLRESAENLIKEKILRGYLAYENDLSIGWCNANDRQNYVRVGSFNPGKRQEEDYYITSGEKGESNLWSALKYRRIIAEKVLQRPFSRECARMQKQKVLSWLRSIRSLQILTPLLTSTVR